MSMYRFHGYPLSKDLQIVARISPIFIFVLATLGLFTTVKKYWRELLFIYGVILITFGEALAYYGSSRFRAPIEPLLVILASAGIWWLTSSDGLRKYWPRREKYVLTEEREPLQPVEQV